MAHIVLTVPNREDSPNTDKVEQILALIKELDENDVRHRSHDILNRSRAFRLWGGFL